MQRMSEISGAVATLIIGGVVLGMIAYNTIALVSDIVDAPLAVCGALVIAVTLTVYVVHSLRSRKRPA